jgi:hypothetical protein
MATGTSISSYLEDQILNWVKGTNVVASPATLYVALYTAAPNDADASGTEVSGNAYARVGVTSVTGWSAIAAAGAGTGDSITNAGIITFPTPTPAGWGTVTHFAIYDSLTVGHELFWAVLTASKVINAGDAVTFPIGSLAIFID